jgi:hypothetical protein
MPTGLADTEGGLYLRPRDLAKVAYLFLKDGNRDIPGEEPSLTARVAIERVPGRGRGAGGVEALSRRGNPAGVQAVAATASRNSASILAASAYGS